VGERYGKADVNAKMQGEGMRKEVMRGANGDPGDNVHESGDTYRPGKVGDGPSE
jgi:hypothetical protein